MLCGPSVRHCGRKRGVHKRPHHVRVPRLALTAAWAFFSAPSLGQEVVPRAATASHVAAYDTGRRAHFPAKDTSIDWGFFEETKQVTLSPGKVVSASIGGDFRIRSENWSDFGFERGQDDGFVLGRIRLGAGLNIGEHFRFYIQARSSVSSHRDLPGGRREFDADDLDLQNAFADVILSVAGDAKLTARAGRQELQFGRERLVSPLDWSNTTRTFDGLRAILEVTSWTVHGFWARPVRIRDSDFNKSDGETDFFGVYASGSPTTHTFSFDFYWLALTRDSAAFNGTAGRETRHTLGARIGGIIPGTSLEYDAEASYQFGDLGGGDISAYMVGSGRAYSFSAVAMSPQIHLGFDYGSGDDAPGGDVGTFNQLFPLAHAYLGFADVVGRQNIVDLSTGLALWPVPQLRIALTGHHFKLDSSADALYGALGGVARPPGVDLSKTVGDELDFTAIYTMGRHLTALFGYSGFWAGPFIEETGSSDNIDFWYLSLTFGF